MHAPVNHREGVIRGAEQEPSARVHAGKLGHRAVDITRAPAVDGGIRFAIKGPETIDQFAVRCDGAHVAFYVMRPLAESPVKALRYVGVCVAVGYAGHRLNGLDEAVLRLVLKAGVSGIEVNRVADPAVHSAALLFRCKYRIGEGPLFVKHNYFI